MSDGIGARVDLAVLSARVLICPPHSLIERERDKQVERLPVGTNRSGISIERQRQSLQGGEGKRLSDNSEKEQAEQRDAGR